MPRLSIDIEARFAQFQDALDKVERNTSRAALSMESAFSKVKGVLGALGVALTAIEFAKTTLDIIKANAALVDLSATAGASVENLSKLQSIAKIGGGNFEDLAGQLGLMVKGLKNGNEEGQKASAALKFLGVTAKNADGSFRDTVEILTDVSKALSKYADDGNKIALVQDALGKGAERFIPFLKDIVEFGDQNAKVTAEQAAKAKEFEVNMNRLKQSFSDARQEMANGLLPTLSKLLEQMNEGIRIAGGFGNALVLFGLKTAPLGKGEAGQRLREYQEQIDELIDSQKRAEETAKQLRAQGDPYAAGYKEASAQADRDIDTLRKKIEFIKFLQRQEALEGRTGPQFLDARDLQARAADGKQSSGYQSPDLAAAATEAKLYQRAMQQLEEELGKLQNLTKAEIVINRVTTGSWKGLTLEHKAYLISIAGEYDDKQLQISQQEEYVKLVENEARVLDKARESSAAYREDRRQELEDLQFQLRLIGESAREQEKLTAMRQIDLAARRKLGELPKDEDGQVLPGSIDAMNRILTEAEAHKKAVRGLIEDRQAAERDWLTGAKNAFNEYADEATNAARNTHDAFINAFRGMEDALVNFVKTGKLDFHSLADSIITDLIRIEVRQNITGPLSQGLAAYFGGGGDLPGDFQGGTFASGGRPPMGKVSLVGERGPELFVPDTAGTIVPNGAWGGDISVNVVNHGVPKDVTATPRRTSDGVVLDLLLRDLRTSGGGRDQLKDYLR